MTSFGFAGTPQFAADLGERLIAEGQRPSFFLTRTDKPRDRGQKVQPSAIKTLALRHSIPCITTERIDEPCLANIRAYQPDVLIIAAFGLILPDPILTLPPLGCINVHTSLLPRWRGAAPIARAIAAGDKQSGVTLMQVSSKLDAGPVLIQKSCPLKETDTTTSLTAKLTHLATLTLLAFLREPARWQPRPQNEEEACYAAKIDKAEAALDWRQPAAILARKVRAFNPSPGCWTRYKERRLKIWLARARAAPAAKTRPGTIVKSDPSGFWIACGTGVLVVDEVQFAGKEKQRIAAAPGLPAKGEHLVSS